MKLYHCSLPECFGIAIAGFRLWPFSLAIAVWSPRLEDWRVFSIGPDPFV